MIVAEIGLNYLGDNNLIKKYIYASKACDGITLQILSKSFYKDKYTNFMLSEESINDFINLAYSNKIKVGLVTDDIDIVKFFHCNKINFYKVLSKDLGNNDLLASILDTNVEKVYLSTGISDYITLDKVVPKINDPRVKLIHTQLSNEIGDVNLKAISSMRKRYSMDVAYGHHCEEKKVIFTSLGFLPESLFFYIKDDTKASYPDNIHAIKTSEIDKLVHDIKSLKTSIGNGEKVQFKSTLG